MAAKNIGKRYAVNRPHVQNLEMTALAMFDANEKDARYERARTAASPDGSDAA